MSAWPRAILYRGFYVMTRFFVQKIINLFFCLIDNKTLHEQFFDDILIIMALVVSALKSLTFMSSHLLFGE